MNKIPAIFAGIFFLCLLSTARGGELDLATALFEDHLWAECRRECRRILIAQPDHETALLLGAIAALREDFQVDQAFGDLSRLSRDAQDAEVRALAGYDAARWVWRNGERKAAWPYLRETFTSTRSPRLYVHSGYLLSVLLKEDPALGANDSALITQLKTSRILWDWNVRTAAMADFSAPQKRSDLGELFIAFYRSQIRPAIGNRCSLHPSCSEYFLEANHHHGWLSVPIVADRLMREPGVVSRGEKPIEISGEIKYEDPLNDHDFWLKK